MADSTLPPGGFYFVINAGSGRQDADDAQAVISDVLRSAGHRCQFFEAARGADLPGLAREALRLAQANDGVIGAAGGDGTLNAVVQVALGGGRPFAMVPRGTFNYFGRTHGIPQDARAAAQALLDARIDHVQVGLVNDHVFLVNASLGLYPQLLEDREAFKRRFGRSRFVAFCSAVASLRRHWQPMPIDVEIDGERRVLSTQSLFVGNNALQLRQVGVPEADAIGHALAVLMLRPVSTAGLFGLLVRGAFSRLGDADSVINFPARELTVQPLVAGRRRRFKVAVDGEIIFPEAPLVFRAAPQALPLLVPREAAAPASDT
jgi:diacylglycerol kinase family enzyme